MNIKEVYQFYQDFVKPIYSEIEAKDNKSTIELFFKTNVTLKGVNIQQNYFVNGNPAKKIKDRFSNYGN